MNTLPVVLFTRNRTCCACATVEALLSHLKSTGWEQRHILCDDMSEPGHVEAVLRVYRAHGIRPSVHVTAPNRHGLGAVMNLGLQDAFSDPSATKCLRIEDDWLLKFDLDIGPWMDKMDRLRIGSLRMGMMFRKRHELVRFPNDTNDVTANPDLWRIASADRQMFTFNNQVAIITREIYDLVGQYPENAKPAVVERYAAQKYNMKTDYGSKPPFVAWPVGWETQVHYGDHIAFAHIGVSISGHQHLYHIPQKYMGYNDHEKDKTLRERALARA